MNAQTETVEKANALLDHQIGFREEWPIARQDLLEKEKEIARLRDQLSAERRAFARAKIDRAYDLDELSGRPSTPFIKQAGFRLVGFVGPLIAAMYLLLQLQKLPNSSLTYSLLSAIVSLLFNFSSSALLKTS